MVNNLGMQNELFKLKALTFAFDVGTCNIIVYGSSYWKHCSQNTFGYKRHICNISLVPADKKSKASELLRSANSWIHLNQVMSITWCYSVRSQQLSSPLWSRAFYVWVQKFLQKKGVQLSPSQF